MRGVLLVTGLVFALPALTALSIAAQGLPSKDEAASILKKAESRMVLTRAGSPPFHLLAKVRSTMGKSSVEGIYEILWSAPDQYREEFRLGRLSATYLALQDKLYILRNTSALTYPEWRVSTLVGTDEGKTMSILARVEKVRRVQRGTGSMVCADFAAPSKGSTECFEPQTGDLLSIQKDPKDGLATLTEDDFLSLRDERYPGHIISKIGDEVLEVRMEKLEVASRFADDVFAPPVGATVRDWCAHPDVAKGKTDDRMLRTFIFDRTFNGFYAYVAPDGRPERFARIYLDGSVKGVPLEDIPSTRFPIHTCGSRPIPYESIWFFYPLN